MISNQKMTLPAPMIEKIATAGASALVQKGTVAAASTPIAANLLTPVVAKTLVAEMKAPTVQGLIVKDIVSEFKGQNVVNAVGASALKGAIANSGITVAADALANRVMDRAGGDTSVNAQLARYGTQQLGVLAAAAKGGLPGAVKQEAVVVGTKVAEIGVALYDIGKLKVQTAQVNADTKRIEQQLAAKRGATTISKPK